MRKLSKSLCSDEKGVTAIEYGLVGVAMATVLAVIFADVENGFIATLVDAYLKIIAVFDS
ncbi:hypothetical protein JCM19231_4821 [Vibrio ishigakensis]|uniref:Flp pilus assembly protein n=1 Tax=Vibrio ishigakensis TaxID=1481914 RepID=A0A0B8P2N1_9VIBR|nr:Flp family type IVb pilin [Vibrio ishigakensis]GAM58837.1 hypothetical protein JCM19231_4821 [Vibrio ishigakensis]